MENTIGIIGGDLRIIKLAELLAEENNLIYTYGLEKYKFNNNVVICNTLQKICRVCDIIIGGIPFSKDGVCVYTPFSNERIKIDNLLKEISNKKLIAGAIQNPILDIAKKHKINVIDLMNEEALTVLNIIPTVEGAIQIAMEETEFTIHSSNCLILGFGRIGKLLSKTLKDLGANVSCVARKHSDISWIKVFGYNYIHIDNLEEALKNNYNIIFNTVPSLILDNKKLEIIKDRTNLIIELASNPGGIDFKTAKEYNIKTIKALGLPGKVAPITSANYIKQTLNKIL